MILKDPKLLAQVPDYSDIIGNKLYDTSKSTLLAYTMKDCTYGSEGRVIAKGIFFEGLYKTKNGNYFWYEYKDEKKGFFGLLPKIYYDNVRRINEVPTKFLLGCFKDLDIKLINIEDEIEIIDA